MHSINATLQGVTKVAFISFQYFKVDPQYLIDPCISRKEYCTNGFMKSFPMIPVVMNKEGKYIADDGNRRLYIAKILAEAGLINSVWVSCTCCRSMVAVIAKYARQGRWG